VNENKAAPVAWLPPVKGDPCSVVVIGGGVTGVLTAWELQRAGYAVTLVEAHALGNGSSSRSAAAIRAQFSTPSTVRGMKFCEEFYEAWTQIMGTAETPISQNGYLFLFNYSYNRRALFERVEMQRQAGLERLEWLKPGEIEERFPYLEITGLIGASWYPKDGFLYPHVIYQEGAEAAKALGATIIQNDEVKDAVVEGNRAVEIELRTGRALRADYYVNATNAWARQVSALFGAFNLPIVTRRRYLYFLGGLKERGGDFGLTPDLFDRLPMIITPNGGYCRPDSSQLMMGWLQFTDPVEPDFDDQDRIEPGFSAVDPMGYGAAVRKEIASYLMAAGEVGRLEAVTSGYYADTQDHNPLIGFDPSIRNLIHAAGFSGHGLMHAPFSARIVGEIIAARKDLACINLPGYGEIDLTPYRIDRKFHSAEGMVI